MQWEKYSIIKVLEYSCVKVGKPQSIFKNQYYN
jgi:hypothetical protein